MEFSRAESQSGRRLTGFGVVVLLHVLVVYALLTGLARKVVEVIKQPIETKIIEEVKPPPPPDLPPPPPPPKMV
ncbi:MAG TPA: energy transducer TonB, partial [Paucimonas sp.]|nr:energy transducer TonB [Paucimonas sp.]